MSSDWWTTPSPDLAYLFGLAFADGHAKRGRNGNQIAGMFVSQKDRGLLEQLAAIAPGGSIRLVRGGIDELWQLYFGAADGLFVDVMEAWGIIPNKTQNGYWPRRMLTQEMLPHYIRGFFDGDGCITELRNKRGTMVWRISFVCHLEHYLKDLLSSLDGLGVMRGKIRQDGRNYRLDYSNLDSMSGFVRVIYKGATIYAKRKRERADRLLEHVANGDHRVGELHHGSKLTERDVRVIRAMRKEGASFGEIADRFRITATQVSRVCRHIHWAHVN